MRNFTQVLLFCLVSICGFGQQNFNLELVANIPVGEDGNDVWGFVDANGLEYAVMGSATATRIWSLEDPTNPTERAVINGTGSIWRDMKSFEDHIYVTTDSGADGLLIINMSQAPDTITSNYWKPTITVDGEDFPLQKCHNLYIDTDQGYCYLSGCNISAGGILIFDLNPDKELPIHVGTADEAYSHDVYVKNDRMYTSEIFRGAFGIYDVSDKSNPIYLNGTNTSTNFTHNTWLSDDGNFLFTTDERGNAYVDAYDISDLDDIKFLDNYRPLETEGLGVIPHNTHYLNGFLITSWYTDGIVVTDVHRPDNIIKVASYDTELSIVAGFDGIWGAYPFLPSGLILASDINHGLFIFQPKNSSTGMDGYQRACYLEGMVTDAMTGDPIPNVSVNILSNDPNTEKTKLMGEYKTGQVTPGEYMVEFNHPAYETAIATAILVSGEVTILDIKLGNSLISGKVFDTDGNIVEGAKVLVENRDLGIAIQVETDDSGEWQAGARANETYSIYAAKWGYRGAVTEIDFIEGTTVDQILEDGYQDDFFTDLGWEVTGNASTGAWEIGFPNSIFGSGTTTQTSMDISGDLGFSYYVTGDEGTGAGSDDIDNGNVILTSPPMDLIGFDKLDLSYYIWFVNVGGNTTPNDFMSVSITNGIDVLELTKIDNSKSEWSSKIEVAVTNEELEFTKDMRIIVYSEDTDPAHVVEVGFDAFNAQPSKTVSTINTKELGLEIFPNPADQFIILTSETAWDGDKTIIITDNMGREMIKTDLTDPEMKISIADLNAGIFSLQIVGQNKRSETLRFTKI